MQRYALSLPNHQQLSGSGSASNAKVSSSEPHINHKNVGYVVQQQQTPNNKRGYINDSGMSLVDTPNKKTRSNMLSHNGHEDDHSFPNQSGFARNASQR